ncbi:hypothetical protein ACQZV8_15060 [Magnetococcales bacterium HHB-1]
MVSIFILFIPGVGASFFVFSAYSIGFLSLMGILSVALNRSWRLPVIFPLAEALLHAPQKKKDSNPTKPNPRRQRPRRR